jgi:hypothetical protein
MMLLPMLPLARQQELPSLARTENRAQRDHAAVVGCFAASQEPYAAGAPAMMKERENPQELKKTSRGSEPAP